MSPATGDTGGHGSVIPFVVSGTADGLFLIRKELQDATDRIRLALRQFLALRPINEDVLDMNSPIDIS